jgi:hypothetical protein
MCSDKVCDVWRERVRLCNTQSSMIDQIRPMMLTRIWMKSHRATENETAYVPIDVFVVRMLNKYCERSRRILIAK